jgi:rfaE bifunctional protein nucleotidyltransferase chain/domain
MCALCVLCAALAGYIMGIVSLETLLPLRERWRLSARRLVFTNGVFDLLHIGHVEYLEQARTLGEVLVVGLNSDASTRAIKGPARPLMPEAARAGMMAALRCVDYVTIFAQHTAEDLLAALQPDIYVKGGDYATATIDSAHAQQVDITRLPEAHVVYAYGGRLVLLPYRAGYSTTTLIERIIDVYGNNER